MRFAWVLLVVVACDDSSGSVARPAGGEAAEGDGEGEGEAAAGPIVVAGPNDFLAKLHAIRCRWAVHCRVQATGGLLAVQADSCGKAVRLDFDFADRVAGGLAADRMEYDHSIAQDCIRKLAEITDCVGLWERMDSPETCPGALTGTVDDGDECTLDLECGLRGRCQLEGACPGVCRSGEGGKGLDDECRLTPECVQGLSCLDGHCRLSRLVGEGCGATSECARGLHCAERGDPEGTCQKVGGDRDVCWGDIRAGAASSCEGELVCAGARFQAPGRCQLGVELEGACSAESPCVLGTVCIDDRCQPALLPGDLCREHAQCPAGLGCFGFKCVAVGVEDEPCDRKRPCDEGICKNGSCAFLPLGVPCLSWSRQGTLRVCPDGYYCGLPVGEGEGEGEAPEEVVPVCVEGPGFGEACVEGPTGGMCKEVLRCHGGFCGRPCVP